MHATETVLSIVTGTVALKSPDIVLIAIKTLLERNVKTVLLVFMVHFALRDAQLIVWTMYVIEIQGRALVAVSTIIQVTDVV
jgi:hypothetical protein